MAEIKYKDTDMYYWCAWGDDICAFGKLESGQKVTSGQPNLENFSTEAELETKVDSIKSEDYYKECTMTKEEFEEYLENK